jgi:outer membrane protein insertion porin family
VNIATPEITVSEDRRWMFITVSINEGPEFTINEVDFSGDLMFTPTELSDKIISKTTEIYSEDTLRRDIQTLTELYQDQGYAFANVMRTLDLVPGENKVDVHFSFERGKIAHFGKISIKGNAKTRDKVIRRELMIREGMKYSGTDMRLSRESVTRLGFFENDSVIFATSTPAGRDDVLDVEISVKERHTAQMSLGAGWSSQSQGFINASVSENNFRGLGQTLSLGFQYAKNTNTFNLSFEEPWLFDTRWTAGSGLYRTKDASNSYYSYTQNGLDVWVGHPIFTKFLRYHVTYKLEDTRIDKTTDLSIDADLENGLASTIEQSLILDKRNNSFEPSKGYFSKLSVDYTGVGGDKKWIEGRFDLRYYKDVWQELVLRTRFAANRLFVNGQPIPTTQKYKFGGARNLRGYDFEDIGPREDVLVDVGGQKIRRSINVGGLASLLATMEFEHPLVREAGLKWVVFADAGNVYANHIGNNGDFDLSYDWGLGLRWFAPIGVLRFEWGFPLNRNRSQLPSQFFFDIGQLF